MSSTPRHDLLLHLRSAEVDCVRRWFEPGMHVLELGGGEGFQADALERLGCKVTSIDVAPRSPGGHAYHEVIEYDGVRVPYPDATFDAVFSSNVLEHIPELPRVLAELRRVQKRAARGVHLVPSVTWRAWTSIFHYPGLVARMLGSTEPGTTDDAGRASTLNRNTTLQLLGKVTGLSAHGAYPGAISELYYFRRDRWKRVLEANGFHVAYAGSNGLFYTGNSILPGMSLDMRRRIAPFLGASCHVLVTQLDGTNQRAGSHEWLARAGQH